MRYGALFFTASFVLASASVSAQSLGDVARREAERRKTAPASEKIYTGETLKPEPSRPAAVEQREAASQAAVPPSPSGVQPDGAKPPSEEQAPQDEKVGRERIQAERDALQRAEIFAEALQSRINALSNDFASRDDPAQRSQVATDRQKALAEMDRVKQEIQQHTKNIATIQEEARKAGVPAGWTR